MQWDWFSSHTWEPLCSSRLLYLKEHFKPRKREHIWKWNRESVLVGFSRVVTGIFLGFSDPVVLHLFIRIQQILKYWFLIVWNFAAVLTIKDLKNVLVSQVKHVKFMYKPLNVILY